MATTVPAGSRIDTVQLAAAERRAETRIGPSVKAGSSGCGRGSQMRRPGTAATAARSASSCEYTRAPGQAVLP